MSHKGILTILLSVLTATLWAAQTEHSFYTLSRQNGLSDDCVWQLVQLSDGRMVVVMPHTVDVYDGVQFSTIRLDSAHWCAVPSYHGATHLFSDGRSRLWLKEYGRLCCLDLQTLRQVEGLDVDADDFFVDDLGTTWLLHGRQLCDTVSRRTLLLPDEAGEIQDVVAANGTVFIFFDSGMVIAYDSTGTAQYQSAAYSREVARGYASTSLVICGKGHCLYQVRTGREGSILLAYDRDSRSWQTLRTSRSIMHTLTQTTGGTLYLTTSDGYMRIDPVTGDCSEQSELHLPDGSVLTTGINTVCPDREGGIWLGTYRNGVLYTSPWCGLFDTRPIEVEVYPILTSISLHGAPLRIGQEYDGRILLSVAPPYVERLSFSHSQNSLAFQFSTMNYMRPRSTCYRYRLSSEGDEWHTVSADSVGGMVDDKGIFYLPLVNLAPGDYTLEVMASTNPAKWNDRALRRISFSIARPWWRRGWAYLGYLVIVLTGSYAAMRRCRQAKTLSEEVHSDSDMVTSNSDVAPLPSLKPADAEWLSRAEQFVLSHISDPAYGVEQLAADLCMERTGLYKRLTALGQPSPVAYIRSIRLRLAAQLLQEGHASISEVAHQTGFSTPGYFGKCFQKEYGCKPLDYKSSAR